MKKIILKEKSPTQIKTNSWIKIRVFDGYDCWGKAEYDSRYKCGACHNVSKYPSQYCPSCGAFMQ